MESNLTNRNISYFSFSFLSFNLIWIWVSFFERNLFLECSLGHSSRAREFLSLTIIISTSFLCSMIVLNVESLKFCTAPFKTIKGYVLSADELRKASFYLPATDEILFNELGKWIEFDGDKLNDDESSFRGDAPAEPAALVPKLFTLWLWWMEVPVVDDKERRCNGEIKASSVDPSTTVDRCWRRVEAWIISGALRRRLDGLGSLEVRLYTWGWPFGLSTCIVVCLVIVRGVVVHDRLTDGVGFLIDTAGGVKGGIITVLFRESLDDGQISSSDWMDGKRRRKKETNLAIVDLSNQWRRVVWS